MGQALLLVVVALTLLGGTRRLLAWWARRRGLARLGDASPLRLARGVPVRVLLQGMPPILGIRRGARLRGDLALTADRFLLVTGRGVLADLAPGRGRPFRSARCTGPERLVIEGDVPRPDGGTGLYRFEIRVVDAEGWAAALQPFVS